MARLATDPELENYARFIARLTLEIERDLRSPQQLLTHMPVRAWEQWQHARPPGRFAGGPVHDADIGPAHLQRVADDRALASVTTRTDQHRWGALALKLDARSGGWKAVKLERLFAARHYRSGGNTHRIEIPLSDKLETARSDRDAAKAALTAVERRIGELPRTRTVSREAHQLRTTWRNVIAELDREITALTVRHDAATAVERNLRRTR